MSELTSIVLLSSFTFKVFPDLLKASPAITCPAPENCTTGIAVVPKLEGVPSCVKTNPLSPFTVPSSTNTNVPPVSSAATFASADLAGEVPTT